MANRNAEMYLRFAKTNRGNIWRFAPVGFILEIKMITNEEICQTINDDYLGRAAQADRWNKNGIFQSLCLLCHRWKFPTERCDKFEEETDITMIRRTKTTGIEITVRGKRSNAEIDNITALLIPDGEQRAPYARAAVIVLWQHLHSDEPVPDDVIGELADRHDCGYAMIVATAIALVAIPRNNVG